MGNQLSLAQVGPSDIEDGSQHPLGVRFAEVVGDTSIVIDIGYE